MNISAILLTAVAGFVLGFLWYGAIGGTLWIKLKEIPQAEIDAARAKGMKAMLPQMIGNFVLQVVMASVMLFILQATNTTTVFNACLLSGILWLGFIAAPFFNAILWEDRKVALYIFDVLFYLVNLKLIAFMLLWLA